MDEILTLDNVNRAGQEDRACEPQAIGDVLSELFERYQARFPNVQITVVTATVEAA